MIPSRSKSILAFSFLLLVGILSNSCGDSATQNTDQEFGLSGGNELVLDFEEIMEFDQGKLGTYPVLVEVPNPGKPVLTFEGLPEGAFFENNKLHYRPSCEMTYEDGNFFRQYNKIYFKATLRSDVDTDQLKVKSGLIIVFKHNERDRQCEDGETE